MVGRNKKIIIASILIASLGIVLRILFLDHGEVVGDEPMYSVRAQGWIDSLASDLQTTPYDWFSTLPWWATWSFHDHPPLVFALQKLAISVIPHPLLAARLVSVLASLLGGFFLYFIAFHVSARRVTAFFAVLLWAVNSAAVGFARLALMESMAVLVVIMSVYVALVAARTPRRLWWLGVMIGVGVLTKYITIMFVPLYLGIFLSEKKTELKFSALAFAMIVAVVISLPVIVYNWGMYSTRGHFDVQFASALHQSTPGWLVLTGKIVRGSLVDRIIHTGSLAGMVSPLFLCLGIVSVLAGTIRYIRNRTFDPLFVVVWGGIVCSIALILFAGSAVRFLFYSIPFLCLASAWGLAECVRLFRTQKVWVAVGIFFLYEMLFTINTIFGVFWGGPWGKYRVIEYAPALVIKDKGIASLDAYLDTVLVNKKPSILAKTAKPAINQGVIAYADNHPRSGQSESLVIVYDPRVEIRTLLQVFARRTFYEQWPIMSANNWPHLIEQLKNNPGVSIIYVHSTDQTVRNQDYVSLIDLDGFQDQLMKRGARYETIKTADGQVAFFVFQFTADKLSTF